MNLNLIKNYNFLGAKILKTILKTLEIQKNENKLFNLIQNVVENTKKVFINRNPDFFALLSNIAIVNVDLKFNRDSLNQCEKPLSTV